MSQPACLTLLVIDDCADDREAYCRYLQQDSLYTYRILEFETVSESITWCQQHTPDVILLDFVLPDGDGLKFIQQFRESHSNSYTAVIMLTGRGDESTAVRAMKSGVQDYLVKDHLTAGVLQSTIHHAVERMHLTRQLEQSREQQQQTEAALKASEEKLKLTLNFAGIGYWEWNPITNQLFASQNAIPCFCSQPSDVNFTLEQWLSQVHIEDRQWVEQELQQAIASQTDYAVEYRVICEDGNIHWVAVKGHGVYDATGQLLQMLGVLMDITERKLSEAERRRAEMLRIELQLLEQILEVVLAGYWDWDIPGNQEYLSLTFKQMLGYEDHELLNTPQTWQSLIFPEDLPGVLELFEQHKQSRGQIPFYNEVRYRHKDGSTVWVICSGRIIEWDQDGNPLRMIGCHINITPRKQLEAQLLAMTNLQQAILDGTDYAIIHNNLDGIQTFNLAAQKMLGYTADEVIRQVNPSFFHDPEELKQRAAELSQELGREIAPGREFFHAVTDNGKTYENEWTYIRKDGSRFPVLLSVKILHDLNGNNIGFLGIAKDISQQKQIEIALKESERRYETLTQAAPVGIFRFDSTGNCIYVNDRWSDLTGRPKQAALGLGWTAALHPEDRDRILKEWSEANFELTGLFYNEGRHLRPDGSINWFHCYILPETNASGTIIGYIGTLTDITIRKQTEEKLSALSERLSLALRSGGFGIWEYDFAQEKQIWDDRMYELYGVSRTEFSGDYEAWWNCVHPDDRSYLLTTIEQVLQGKQEYNVEFRIVQPNGKMRYLKGYGILNRNQQGEPVRIIGVNFDISEQQAALRERKQAEQELIRHRDLREAIFNESADALFLVDPQTLFTLDCNRRAVELFEAVDKIELIFIEGHKLQRREFSPDEMADIVKQMQLNGVWSREIEYVTLKGKVFWGNIAAKPITVAGHTMNLVRISDITNHKQAEEELQQTNQQLANTNIELARATRLKDEFLANMSHELRTPLNAILGMSEGFLEGVFGSINERQIKAIATIERSGRHLLELINDILDLSKIESGKLELQLSDVSVRSLCEASLAFIKQMALKKNIHLSTHIANNIRSIPADERRLRQVLINLLSNAVKFTPAGGSVALEVRLEEAGEPLSPNLCFHITDSGIGIAPEDIGKLFQPFIQLDSSLNRQYNGTGLGLALVQRIVSLHSGTVSVSSDVGHGSCFSVCIPYCTSERESLRQVTTSLPSYHIKAKNALVLIIEDSVPAADQITRYLYEMGMQPVIYPQGEGAVEEALRLQPALIILDLQLPNLSGWDVLEQFKNHPQTKEIPVIIISVVDEHTKGLAHGAFEYLVKPITRVQLQTAIDKLQNLIVLPKPVGATPLILLAEDNQANIDTMSGYLESRGYHLIVANNGQKAIATAQAQHPDLIVMDIQMPEMDGLEAIRRIRNNPQFLYMPIIALTALAMPGDRETCLAAGANEYLTKPVKLKQLVATIQQLLGR